MDKQDLFDDGLGIDGNWWMEYERLNDGNIKITIYDKDQSEYARVYSKNIVDAFRHALHYADPMITANLFNDHFDWENTHKVKFERVDE